MTAHASMTVAVPEADGAPARVLRRAEPCTVIIFGAGDLLHRKLMPSLFHLMGDGLLPDDFAVITVARSDLDDDSFRMQVRDALRTFGPNSGAGLDSESWERFANHLHYVPGELDDPATYDALRQRLMAMVGRPVNIQGTRDWVQYLRGILGQPYLTLFGSVES